MGLHRRLGLLSNNRVSGWPQAFQFLGRRTMERWCTDLLLYGLSATRTTVSLRSASCVAGTLSSALGDRR